MRGPAKSALPLAIVTLASSLLSFSSLGTPANAAPTCQAAPKPAAPDGSHWYYRTDRATQRKCWYLSSGDKDKDAPQQTTSASLRTNPAAKQKAPRADDTASSEISANANDAPKSVKTTTIGAAPQPPVIAQASDMQPEAPGPQRVAADASSQQQTQPAADPQPLPVVESPPLQQPTPLAATPAPTTAPSTTSMLQYIFLAIAALGLAGGLFLYIAELRRRRDDVLVAMKHGDAPSMAMRRDETASAAARPAPGPAAFVDRPAPVPPAADLVHEDIADLLKRLSQHREQRPKTMREPVRQRDDHQDLSSVGSSMRA